MSFKHKGINQSNQNDRHHWLFFLNQVQVSIWDATLGWKGLNTFLFVSTFLQTPQILSNISLLVGVFHPYYPLLLGLQCNKRKIGSVWGFGESIGDREESYKRSWETPDARKSVTSRSTKKSECFTHKFTIYSGKA